MLFKSTQLNYKFDTLIFVNNILIVFVNDIFYLEKKTKMYKLL